MRVADVAEHLYTDHAVAGVGFLADIVRLKRLEVTGPAAAGVELGVGRKQRRAATDTAVDAMLGGVPVSAGKRPFGPFSPCDREFFRGQFGAPLRVALDDFLH
jgi:hypothetical protein